MVKKRLIGTIIVKNGWVVQSFSYGRYLPLGRPTTVAKNLDRWGVDEIAILAIDRSPTASGPDFDLLRSIRDLNLTTPISYGGGIRSAGDAKRAIEIGCERVVVESLLFKDQGEIENLVKVIGGQAVIASIPITNQSDHLCRYDYINKREFPLEKNDVRVLFDRGISELLVIDKDAEGSLGEFELEKLQVFRDIEVKLIAFGGVVGGDLISSVLRSPNVSAIAVGNSLNYREQAVHKIKQDLHMCDLRGQTFRFNRSFFFGNARRTSSEGV